VLLQGSIISQDGVLYTASKVDYLVEQYKWALKKIFVENNTASSFDSLIILPQIPTIEIIACYIASLSLELAVAFTTPLFPCKEIITFELINSFLKNKQKLKLGSNSLLNNEKPALLISTSGSTGEPKFVVLSYRALFYSILQTIDLLELNSNDVWLLTLPLQHVSGALVPIRVFSVGAKLCILEQAGSSPILRSIQENKVSIISLVPTQIQKLLSIPNAHSILSTLKYILVGGSRVSKSFEKDCIGLPIVYTYGMTETASHVVATKSNFTHGNVGKALAYSKVAINELDNRISIHSKTLFSGYVDSNGIHPIEDEFFLTNDCGFFNSNGDLHITGRVDDIFISGGKNASISILENFIHNNLACSDCKVIAVDNSLWGQRVILYIERSEIITVETQNHLNESIKSQLGPEYVPIKIYVLKQFPRSTLGKVLVKELSTFVKSD
jgi:o-succinylbenzoate---CoA ligase